LVYYRKKHFKDLPVLGFKFRIVQPLANPNTDYAIPVPLEVLGPDVIYGNIPIFAWKD
jgi:hypothetical protein